MTRFCSNAQSSRFSLPSLHSLLTEHLWRPSRIILPDKSLRRSPCFFFTYNWGKGNNDKRQGSEWEAHGFRVFYTNSGSVINKMDTGIACTKELDIIGMTKLILYWIFSSLCKQGNARIPLHSRIWFRLYRFMATLIHVMSTKPSKLRVVWTKLLTKGQGVNRGVCWVGGWVETIGHS